VWVIERSEGREDESDQCGALTITQQLSLLFALVADAQRVMPHRLLFN
jgi:hypothetical protein